MATKRREEVETEERESITERIGEGIGYGIGLILIPFTLLCIIMLFQARMDFIFQ